MKDIVKIYKQHKMSVDNYLKSFIKSYDEGSLLKNTHSPLSDAKYVQLVYSLDEYFRQTSAVICRQREEQDNMGNDKSHYFNKIVLDEYGFYISNPYIHHRTGHASISVVYKKGSQYYIFDIDLIKILEDLKLLEYNSIHDKFKRGVYFIGSTLLALVALILIIYGGFELHLLFDRVDSPTFFHSMFTSIISITLGIAIFDLAKQIFEYEVLFHTFTHSEDKQYKVLGKFLVSIVIALSIETLMVVFKLALNDYKSMIAAFYLLVGTTIMIVGLAYFYKTVNGNKTETK